MVKLINVCLIKARETFVDNSRNTYSKAQNIGYKALNEKRQINVYHQPESTGWTMVFIQVENSVEYHQVFKKKIRTSDLKYFFGGV